MRLPVDPKTLEFLDERAVTVRIAQTREAMGGKAVACGIGRLLSWRETRRV
jgi:hypothetical protein